MLGVLTGRLPVPSRVWGSAALCVGLGQQRRLHAHGGAVAGLDRAVGFGTGALNLVEFPVQRRINYISIYIYIYI